MACNLRCMRRIVQSAYLSGRFSNAVLFSRQPLSLRSLSFSCRRPGPDPPIPPIDDDKQPIDNDKQETTSIKQPIDDDKKYKRAIMEVHQKPYSVNEPPDFITIRKVAYPTDAAWFNLPYSVCRKVGRRMHLERDHPVCLTRQIIEMHFPSSHFKRVHEISPIVTTQQNFDSLGIPPDHPGRSPSDTYYINKNTVLRTHASAHQAEMFGTFHTGHIFSASVFRRDAVDRSHYPCFHQLECARYWYYDRTPDLAAAVLADLESLPKHDVPVEDPNPPWHPETNPRQEKHHSEADVKAVVAHLKRSLENMVADLFKRAKAAAEKRDQAVGKSNGINDGGKPLKMRWTEAYFPFTSPSWELEVLYDDEWIEVLGCGVVKQELFINAGQPLKIGWACGLGIDRLAMILFQITDIRMLWCSDKRFLSQFAGLSRCLDKIKAFAPFSKFPPNQRSVSFWLPLKKPPPPSTTTSSSDASDAPEAPVSTDDSNPLTTTTTTTSSSPAPKASASTLANINYSKLSVHPNDVMDLVRGVAGNVVEDVKLIDVYTHPETGKTSMAFHMVYRSLENQLSRKEANNIHDKVKIALTDKLGVEIR